MLQNLLDDMGQWPEEPLTIAPLDEIPTDFATLPSPAIWSNQEWCNVPLQPGQSDQLAVKVANLQAEFTRKHYNSGSISEAKLPHNFAFLPMHEIFRVAGKSKNMPTRLVYNILNNFGEGAYAFTRSNPRQVDDKWVKSADGTKETLVLGSDYLGEDEKHRSLTLCYPLAWSAPYKHEDLAEILGSRHVTEVIGLVETLSGYTHANSLECD